MSEELVPESSAPPQLTPEEFVQELQQVIMKQQLILDEHKTNLLNTYSILVRELRAELHEAAQELKRPHEKPFNRESVIKNLNTAEAEENVIFQVQNNLISNQKKLEAFKN